MGKIMEKNKDYFDHKMGILTVWLKR